jgi:hypothetical protein
MYMKYVSLITTVIVLLTLSITGAWAGPATVDDKELATLKTLIIKDTGAGNEFAKIRSFADGALKLTPNPIERVVSEGTLAADPRKIVSNQSMTDIKMIESLAWVAVVSGDDRYAAKARLFIVAWAKKNKSDGNAINETKFEPLVESYDLLRAGFSAEERAIVDDWLRTKAKMLWNDPRHQEHNWQSQRVKMVGLIGLATHDSSLWSLAVEGFRKQIEGNFESNGESVDFKVRDALHYHLYAIEPLLVVACAADRQGVKLFSYKAPDGSSLQAATDFMLPYIRREKQHLEFAHSTVEFDRKRASAGESTYKLHAWEPKESLTMLTEADCLSNDYGKLAPKVAGTPNRRFLNWRMVVNAAVRQSTGR